MLRWNNSCPVTVYYFEVHPNALSGRNSEYGQLLTALLTRDDHEVTKVDQIFKDDKLN